jgi:hypothetical protein
MVWKTNVKKRRNIPIASGLEACRAGLPFLLTLMGRRSRAHFFSPLFSATAWVGPGSRSSHVPPLFCFADSRDPLSVVSSSFCGRAGLRTEGKPPPGLVIFGISYVRVMPTYPIRSRVAIAFGFSAYASYASPSHRFHRVGYHCSSPPRVFVLAASSSRKASRRVSPSGSQTPWNSLLFLFFLLLDVHGH